MTNALIETAKVVRSAITGDRVARGRLQAIAEGSANLQETISSSDLARAFMSGLRQQVEDQYQQQPATWSDFAKRVVLPDFKPSFLRELIMDPDTNLADNGGETTAVWSLPNVPEGTEYPSFGFTTNQKQISTSKKGARIPFTWEMVINDEWHLLEELPTWMLRYAKNTEDTQAYGVITSSTGPNPATFSATNKNTPASGAGLFNQNFKLDLNGLALAKKELQNRKVNGQYLAIQSFRLIVPRNMEDYARALLKVNDLVLISADGKTRATGTTTNSNVKLTVSDWLTRIDKSANAANTWYLVPDGGFDGTRTTIALSFLLNQETPDLRTSNNGGLYLGGGAVPANEGSLLNDDIEYRVRHVVSGAYLNPGSLLASTSVDGVAPAQYGVV